jgi:hypothetical protein
MTRLCTKWHIGDKVPDPTRAEHSDFDLNRAVAR